MFIIGTESCTANNVSIQAALLACVHLSGLSDSCYHDACVFDLCMGGSAVCMPQPLLFYSSSGGSSNPSRDQQISPVLFLCPRRIG